MLQCVSIILQPLLPFLSSFSAPRHPPPSSFACPEPLSKVPRSSSKRLFPHCPNRRIRSWKPPASNVWFVSYRSRCLTSSGVVNRARALKAKCRTVSQTHKPSYRPCLVYSRSITPASRGHRHRPASSKSKWVVCAVLAMSSTLRRPDHDVFDTDLDNVGYGCHSR